MNQPILLLLTMNLLTVWIFLLVFFCSEEVFSQSEEFPESKVEIQEEPSLPSDTFYKDTKKWKGDIIAVYPNKEQLKIKISRAVKKNRLFSEFRDSHEIFQEIKKDIESQGKVFTIYQKGTDRILGKFEVQEIIEEEVSMGKKKEIELSLRGKFKADQPYWKRLVNLSAYIVFTQKEVSYIEPLNVFPDRISSSKTSITHPLDRKEMVLIPSGLFIHGQGLDASRDDFNPAFLNPSMGVFRDLPSFYIDKYEVTNAEYKRYLNETKAPHPKHWIGGNFPKGKENHPVINLSYREVEGYARWTGKRIPTELEWEKSARGSGVDITQNRDESLNYELTEKRYPFGDDFDPSLCNTKESGIGDTVSVYEMSLNGASVYGVMGLCGNAPEWTSSWYDLYPGHNLTGNYFGKQYKVIRGGSYLESRKQAYVYSRQYGGIPNLRDDRKAGFRLVMEVK